MRRIREWLEVMRRPSKHISLGVLSLGGFIAGIIFWGGFNTALEAANTEDFCVTCHEMRDNVYQELQETVHWSNHSGVRATCPDCHVPHEWTNKIARKMQASKELWGWMFGTIDTPEKFEEKRLTLARHEWARLSANGSLECRNCHDYDSMDFDQMSDQGRIQMAKAAEKDQSCIDCHKGIAHKLPEDMSSGSPMLADLEAMSNSVRFKAGETYYSIRRLQLFEDKELSKPAGQLNAGTSVKVLSVSGDALQVELDTWRKKKGFGRVLFYDFGKNIVEGYLTREVAGNDGLLQTSETREDDLTGLPWQQVKVALWMNAGSMLDSPDALWEKAKESYDTNCSICHTQPAEDHFDANTWPGMFNGMLSFVSMDQDSQALVLKYLQKHSSDYSTTAH
jgi:trimethylamine-N-oxide reductase cytochrome c-type subunit TorC